MSRFRALGVICIFCTSLAACASRSPDAALRQVAVSCVNKETPPAPEVHAPAQLAKIPDGPTLFTMTAADYGKLYAWMLLASPVLEGCRAAGAP